MHHVVWSMALVFACGGKDDDASDDDTGAWSSDADGAPMELDGDDPEEEDDGITTAEDMPAKPAPFTLTISDGTSVEFDLPSCSHYRGSSNFRTFWRKEDRSHVYVLIMEVMGSFDGVGSYSSNDGTVRVKMQQEAGGDGSGSSFNTNDVEGAEVILTLDYLDEDLAWGEVSLTSMWNSTQEVVVDVTPNTLPVWCEDLAI